MNIVKERLKFFHTLSELVPKQLQNLWNVGWQAFSAGQVASLRSSIRRTSANWNTAAVKLYRLTRNVKFLALFPMLMVSQGLVSPHDVIVVDFSDFGSGKWVLMFAKQTKKGRTLPVYFEVLAEQSARGFQNTFVIECKVPISLDTLSMGW